MDELKKKDVPQGVKRSFEKIGKANHQLDQTGDMNEYERRLRDLQDNKEVNKIAAELGEEATCFRNNLGQASRKRQRLIKRKNNNNNNNSNSNNNDNV